MRMRIYVDSIEFKNGATNTDNAGNYTAFHFNSGMKIYYAQALMNGASIAEKLNGKNGGGFLWVSNYAGVYSSTNLRIRTAIPTSSTKRLVDQPEYRFGRRWHGQCERSDADSGRIDL